MNLITSDGTSTTCPYCGVGCGVIASQEKNELLVVGDKLHPANHGQVCVKGDSLAETQTYAHRVTKARVNGEPESIDYAMSYIAEQFKTIIDTHGPNAIAFYLSGQLLTEDYYVANKLMKGFIGSANVDTNSRLCMASAVAAHKRAFGEDVVPCNYADLDEADLIVLAGSNMAWTHPVIYKRIQHARKTRGTRVVVIDPRETATCEVADLHLAIKPGSDTLLFNGLLRHLATVEAVDIEFVNQHTNDFDLSLASAGHSAAQISDGTALSQTSIETFFEWFARTKKTVTVFSQGINQASDGTDKANAIINCHLATGRIGQPGMGPFSITGQPNAMGGREVGGMANQLAAHMDFDSSNIESVGQFWHAKNMVRAPGLKAVDMFKAIRDGEIKAIWIMGTNPAVSLPNTNEVTEALENCPLVILSEVTGNTDTAQYADVLLPAAGWGEKDGTVTNSERCISRQRAFTLAPGDALPDWQLVCRLATALGFESDFAYQSAADIFREHARLTSINNHNRNDGRDDKRQKRLLRLNQFNDIDQQSYDDMAPFQWATQPYQDRQFSTPDRRARFIPIKVREPIKFEPDQFTLNSGRLRDQWHTMTRTGNARKLFQHRALPSVDIHPDDAQAIGCTDNELVAIYNELGCFNTLTRLTTEVGRNQLFAPIHWSHQFNSSGPIGKLYGSVVDAISGQPASKTCGVKLAKVKTKHWALMEARSSLTLLENESLLFWARIPGDQQTQNYVIGWGGSTHTINQYVKSLTTTTDVIHYRDSQTQESRALGILDGQTQWRLQVTTRFDALIFHPLLPEDPAWQSLSALRHGPIDNSPTICSCYEVKQTAIQAAIKEGLNDTESLGARLKCGTNCGSCLPELSKLIRQYGSNTTEEATHV